MGFLPEEGPQSRPEGLESNLGTGRQHPSTATAGAALPWGTRVYRPAQGRSAARQTPERQGAGRRDRQAPGGSGSTWHTQACAKRRSRARLKGAGSGAGQRRPAVRTGSRAGSRLGPPTSSKQRERLVTVTRAI